MESFAKTQLKCFQSLFQCWKMFVSSYPWNNFLLYLLLCATQNTPNYEAQNTSHSRRIYSTTGCFQESIFIK